MTDWQQWVEKCRVVLEGNQIQSGRYRYTRPASHVYEYQWLWDSCFHAITYRWFDLEMARQELLSVVGKQVQDGADSGMIPHMNYWQPDGAPLWNVADRSIITQPPLIAIATELVDERSPAPAFLQTMYTAVSHYHNWFERRRVIDGDHLVGLIHPWEPGCDASPRWDALLGLVRPTPDQSKAARHALVQTLIAHDCDARRLAEAGSFFVKPMGYNAIRAADLEALGRIAHKLGKVAEAKKWAEKAERVKTAVFQKCVFPDGVFDLAGLSGEPIREESAQKLFLLFGGCVDRETAVSLVRDLTSERFTTAYPVTTTPTSSPNFAPDQYWRGNVWLSVNWLIYKGLKRYGFDAEATQIAQRSLALVEKHGFYEYFNPISGTGYGPALQSWSTIILDMLALETV